MVSFLVAQEVKVHVDSSAMQKTVRQMFEADGRPKKLECLMIQDVLFCIRIYGSMPLYKMGFVFVIHSNYPRQQIDLVLDSVQLTSYLILPAGVRIRSKFLNWRSSMSILLLSLSIKYWHFYNKFCFQISRNVLKRQYWFFITVIHTEFNTRGLVSTHDQA